MASTKKAAKRAAKKDPRTGRQRLVKATATPKAASKKPSAKKRSSTPRVAKKAATKPRANQTGATGKPTTIDEYLNQVDAGTRELLQRLRRTIHELVPEVVECISYSMPAFRYQGKVIAGFLATKAGASYFPFSGTTLGTLAAELEGRSQTKSGLHFTPEQPLSKSLVKTLLQARIAEL